MAQIASPQASRSGPLPQLPDWVTWLQAGLTALLAVLFIVMVGKARQQGAQIQELQERLQGLENSRALERTTGLEEQLRSTVERLQVVERNSSRIEVLTAEAEALRAEVRQMKRAAATPPAGAPPPSGADSSSAGPGTGLSPRPAAPAPAAP